MATLSSPEQGPSLNASPESHNTKLIVSQPAKMIELNRLLDTFDNFSDKISERTGEDRSGDMGGGGQNGVKRDDSKTVSPRDQAIANVPAPAVMQKQLQSHIQKEVQELAAKARHITRANQPGSAHEVNKLYARIRRLNNVLASILEASVDVLKRLFIRVFIDEQPVL
ncbi:MAG: hypothetical protein JWM56_576 [Candidatus Peribacteria bacterium]|nr:hypothetical protein [Candidatus Peribacteria bacterium]